VVVDSRIEMSLYGDRIVLRGAKPRQSIHSYGTTAKHVVQVPSEQTDSPPDIREPVQSPD
jgi:hypothetical protein